MDLSEQEKKLYIELIIKIIERSIEILIIDSQREKVSNTGRCEFKNLVIDHLYQSDFENTCYLLQHLGLVHPLNQDLTLKDDPKEWSGLFRIKYDQKEIIEYLEQNLETSSISLTKVFESFFHMCADYGREQPVTTRREPFDVPVGYSKVFKLLLNCEYCEEVDGKLKWADKIGSMMIDWNEDLAPFVEIAEQEIKYIWQTMPSHIKKRNFHKGKANLFDIIEIVKFHLKDGIWLDLPSVQPYMSLSIKKVGLYANNNTFIARKLIEIYLKELEQT